MTAHQYFFILGCWASFALGFVSRAFLMHLILQDRRRWKFRTRVLIERLEARGVSVKLNDEGIWLTWKTDAGVPAGFCAMMRPDEH